MGRVVLKYRYWYGGGTRECCTTYSTGASVKDFKKLSVSGMFLIDMKQVILDLGLVTYYYIIQAVGSDSAPALSGGITGLTLVPLPRIGDVVFWHSIP